MQHLEREQSLTLCPELMRPFVSDLFTGTFLIVPLLERFVEIVKSVHYDRLASYLVHFQMCTYVNILFIVFTSKWHSYNKTLRSTEWH